MHDSSKWIDVLGFVAVLAAAGGILLPLYPWSSLAFASVAAATVFWMRRRTAHRSTAQVIWDVEAEGRVAELAPARRSPLIERF